MASVDIVIKATDQASAVLNKVSGSMGKLDKASAQAGGGLGKLGSTLNNAVRGITGFDLATVASVGSIVAVANAAKKAVSEYSNYVEQIDKMTMSTGMSADELSRLVQVADDFRVDMGSMQGALKMALQNGFQPTTENLARLADEMRAIQDPTQKAAKLQEIFGKQWQNVVPLLDRGGAAIRQASAGIADGLVVTQDAINKNRAYQKSLDDLGDAWLALKNTMVQDALPGITGSLQVFSDNIAKLQQGKNILDVLASNQRAYANLEVQMSQKTQDANRYLLEQYEAMKKVASATPEAADEVEDFSLKEYDAARATADWKAEADQAAWALDEIAQRSKDAAQAQTDLANAQASLQQAQMDWKDSVGNDMARLLQDGWISADRYKEGLKAIDAAQGTNLATEKEFADKKADLAKKFRDGQITAGDFSREIGMLTAAYTPLNKSITEATALIDALQEKVNQLTGHVYTVYVKTSVEGPLASGLKIGTNTNGGNSYNWEDYAGRRASGGPVTRGTPYIVGEVGPELFVPGQSGRIIPNNQMAGATYNYNLTVYTTQSAAVVQQSFAKMRALAGV